ncbi:hypothetical protein IQ07DRAFT_582792, partial [Pyrenochaeta sp. DS3sAY3a]
MPDFNRGFGALRFIFWQPCTWRQCQLQTLETGTMWVSGTYGSVRSIISHITRSSRLHLVLGASIKMLNENTSPEQCDDDL